MINEAHVGVGISGLEGQQAARASDFAITEFKNLKDIIFAHGREAYRRNAYLVNYVFYKNIVFVMPQFWFGFFTLFSAQSNYDQWVYQFYNIFFTAIPIVWFAIFDWEFDKEKFKDDPDLYIKGRNGKIFR